MTRHRTDDGLTLVELLVVMIVVGLLAAIAVPAALGQRRRASEASVKSDVRAVTQEVLAFYVDGTGPLSVTGSAGTWSLLSDATTVAQGRLGDGNSVSAATVIPSGSSYCISVIPSAASAHAWHAEPAGLAVGDC